MAVAIPANKTQTQVQQNVLTKDSFFIRINNQLKKVDLREIDWIHADGNYCFINASAKKFAVKISLRRLVLRLSPLQFIRIHKSYVVNIDRIEGIDMSENSVLIGKQRLPIGRVYKEELFKRLDIL